MCYEPSSSAVESFGGERQNIGPLRHVAFAPRIYIGRPGFRPDLLKGSHNEENIARHRSCCCGSRAGRGECVDLQVHIRVVDFELTAGGQITVSTDGEVTGVSGVISGLADQTISGIAPNPNFSGAAYSPDGSFIYDNLYHASGMPFDVDGLLFVTAQNPGGYWNLWGTSPGNYSLWSCWQLQLPDRGERNSECGRCAGIVDLGNDAHRIRWAGLCELPRVAKDSRGRPSSLAAGSSRAGIIAGAPRLGSASARSRTLISQARLPGARRRPLR